MCVLACVCPSDPTTARTDALRIGVLALEQACEPEVGHAHDAVVAEQHVLGLEVAVYEPGGVDRRQPARRGQHHLDDLAGVRVASRIHLRRSRHASSSITMNTRSSL